MASDTPREGIPQRTSGMAITSLVLAIVSPCVPLILPIVGLVFGILGLRDVAQGRGRVSGQGLAIAGIILNVLSLIFVPLLLLFPAVQSVRNAANRAKSLNNLKQIGLAYHNYHDSFQQCPAPIASTNGEPILSWRVSCLPYIEEDARYRQFQLNESWDSPQNRRLLDPVPRAYKDPFLGSGTDTSYRTFVGPGTLYPSGTTAKYTIGRIPRGNANLIVVAEAAEPVPWSKPQEIRPQPGAIVSQLGNPGNRHFLVLFLDGSVRVMDRNVPEAVMKSAIDPDDRQNAPVPY